MKKITKFILAIIILALLLSCIVSQDAHILENCKNEHCAICEIIYTAQNIIALSILILFTFLIKNLIQTILSKMHKKNEKIVQLSLVFQKVQFNE